MKLRITPLRYHDIDDGDGGGSGGDDGGDFDLGSAMESIAQERGDKLGDGAPPPPADPPAAPPVATQPPGQPAPGTPPAGTPPAGNASPPAPPTGGERRPPDLSKAPTSWKPEVAGAWATLPPAVQAEIHRREEDSYRGIAEVKSRADLGTRLQQTLAPFEQEMRQFNIDPFVQINNLMQAHRTLALGTPAQKQAMMAELSRAYKVPLGAPQAGAVDDPTAGWVDPQLKALQDELQTVKSRLETDDQRKADEHRQRLAKEVTDFSKDAAHPHFDAVADQMSILIKGSGGTMSLKDAYEQAVWMVPTVRDKLVAAQQEAAATAAQEAEKERAATAAKARNSVRSSSKSVTDTGKLGTMEDTLKETLASIQARGK